MKKLPEKTPVNHQRNEKPKKWVRVQCPAQLDGPIRVWEPVMEVPP